MKEINREHFEHWLAINPLDRRFEFNNICGCALHYFLKEIHGLSGAYIGNTGYYPLGLDGPRCEMPQWLDGGNLCGVLRVHPLTIANMKRRYIELFGDPNPEPSALRTIIAEALRPE